MSNDNMDQPATAGAAEPAEARIQVEPVFPSQAEEPGPAQVLPGEILARLESLELELREQTERFQTGLNALSEKVGFLPPQIRNLGAKIDAVASVAADSKYRSLLLTLLGLHDLVGQMRLGTSNGEGPSAFKRPLDVIFTQIQQILEGHGLKEIPASEAFDPAMHCAVQVVPTDDGALDGKIARLLRPGFALAGRSLRFAEVEIWKLRAPASPPAAPHEAAAGLGAVPEPSSPAPEPSERLTV